MLHGTLVTVSAKGVILKREVAELTSDEDYPRLNADGSTTAFFPLPYFHFTPGIKLNRSLS